MIRLSYPLTITPMGRKKSKEKYVVSIELENSVIENIDTIVRNLKQSGHKVSRTSICKELVSINFNKSYSSPTDQFMIHDILIKISSMLRDEAIGDKEKSSSLYLLAAVKELEALSVIDVKSENLIKSSLLQIVLLLKKATGYKTLPDVPSHNITNLPS